MKHGKVWGTTEAIFGNALIEVHRLIIEPGAYCSWHMHERKSNMFIVLSGELTIEVQKNDYPLTDRTTLLPGDVTTVIPGEFHRFVAGTEPVMAFEVYYPEALGKDIIRKDVGGKEGYR
jgi:mannose-6-phosphate isomerase-like protein (cupin superfamily)